MELANDDIITKLVVTWIVLFVPFCLCAFCAISRKNPLYEKFVQIVLGIWVLVFVTLLLLGIWI